MPKLYADLRQINPPPVTPADRARALAGLQRFTDQAGPIDPRTFPDRQPFFSGFLPADDGHLRVARYAPPAGEWTTFHVFDPDGRYLGEVRSPVPRSSHPVLPRILASAHRPRLGHRQQRRHRAAVTGLAPGVSGGMLR